MVANTKGAAPFLCRTEGGDLEIVMARYSGAIPAKVLRRFTRHMKRLAERGALFPADPLDIYQHAFGKLEQCARNLPADVKSPEAYLATASRLIVMKARERIVGKMRDEYRQVEGVRRPDGLGGAPLRGKPFRLLEEMEGALGGVPCRLHMVLYGVTDGVDGGCGLSVPHPRHFEFGNVWEYPRSPEGV